MTDNDASRSDLEGMTTSVLFDVVADVGGQLQGLYAERSRDERLTADERARWWQKVTEVRDDLRQVGPDDRDRMADLFERWRQEIIVLRDGR